MITMSNVLVTGGAGSIGSHIAAELIHNGYSVTVLDDLSGGFIDNLEKEVKFVQGSINDVELVDTLFKQGNFTYIFHLAAYAAEGLSHFIKRFNYTNNLIGSVNLINASINYGIRCFVFTSSIAVYGTCPELPMTEKTIPHPEDSYGIAKLSIEHELRACKDIFGLDYIIFRPHNVYGERQNVGDKYRNVGGIFMNQILQDRPMTIFGDGSQTRAFSYIGDVAPVIARSIDMPRAYNQVFNIGADQPYSVNELARAVAHAMGVDANILHLPARSEVLHAFSSHDKIREVFGDSGLHSLEEGLARMAEWVRQHGARTSRKFENIEVTKNFPAAWLS